MGHNRRRSITINLNDMSVTELVHREAWKDCLNMRSIKVVHHRPRDNDIIVGIKCCEHANYIIVLDPPLVVSSAGAIYRTAQVQAVVEFSPCEGLAGENALLCSWIYLRSGIFVAYGYHRGILLWP